MLKKLYEFKELQKKKGKKGFSMIELIIVIAIMAILIALIGTQLIPYLEKSRRGKDLNTLDACLTNFQSAIAEAEGKTAALIADGITNLDDFKQTNGPSVKSAYESIAGDAYKTDTGITATFKSKAASGGTVQFGMLADGRCFVFVETTDADTEGLVVSSSYSGPIKECTDTAVKAAIAAN